MQTWYEHGRQSFLVLVCFGVFESCSRYSHNRLVCDWTMPGYSHNVFIQLVYIDLKKHTCPKQSLSLKFSHFKIPKNQSPACLGLKCHADLCETLLSQLMVKPVECQLPCQDA